MYLEKRKSGKSIKYFLVHSYRNENNKVAKLRRFLGTNLTDKELKKLKILAEKYLQSQIDDMQTKLFDFALSDKKIESINKYNDKISIVHFTKKQWYQFTEEFIYNTNAIEGSTVLLEEVPQILKKRKIEDPEEIETKGVAKAIKFIRRTKLDLSLKLILNLHKFCFEGSKYFAGKFRDVEVIIRDREGNIIHSGTPVSLLDTELQNFIKWYKQNKKKFKPLALATIIHNEFEDIHPFQDGNGRVGRLLLNFILLKNNYPPINILLKDRAEYYHILQEYQKRNKIIPSLKFFIKQYKKTLKQVTTKKKN